MGKISVAKSSKSKSKRSSSANTLSKSSSKRHSNGMVRDNSLQTFHISPIKTRSRLHQLEKFFQPYEIIKRTEIDHVIKEVEIKLVDLIHTNLLTQWHQRTLQRLKEKKLGLSHSICSSFESRNSEISSSSIRINNRELRSLPARNERIKQESLVLKYVHQPDTNVDLNSSGNVSIIEKFHQKDIHVKVGDDEKKWRFWNGDICSEGSSSRRNSIKSCQSSDIFSSDSSETGQKRKRRRGRSKVVDTSPKSVPKKKKKDNKLSEILFEQLSVDLSAAEETIDVSTTPEIDVEAVTKNESILSSTKIDEKDIQPCEPKITSRRTVETWCGNKKTIWILNVMPKSEAVRTGKFEKIKKTRMERNPLHKSNGVPKKRSYKKRGPYKKREKKENKKDEKNKEDKKTKIETAFPGMKTLCCYGTCECKPEDDLVVHKLPSMPAIGDAGGVEAIKKIKSDVSLDSKSEPNPKIANKRESNVANSEPPSKLRKLNDGKKRPEIINDTVFPANSIIKAIGRIPKKNPNTKVSNDNLKEAFDNWAKIPELTPLLSPAPSVKEGDAKLEEKKKMSTPKESQKKTIVYDIKNDEEKLVPLTMANVKLFSEMIKNRLSSENEMDRRQPRVKRRISRCSTGENNSVNKKVTTDERKSRRGRKDWKKESSQINDGTNSSSESSPLLKRYLKCNSDDSLPKFGQIQASASNPSTSETPIERRLLHWIYKDLNVSDNKDFNNDFELSDDNSPSPKKALTIDDKQNSTILNNTNNQHEVDSNILEINNTQNSDISMENLSFADQPTLEGKSVNESIKNLNDTRQSVAEEGDKINDNVDGLLETQKVDADTSSISSSSSIDSNKSSDSSSSSSSASSQSSSSSSNNSNSTNVSKLFEIIEQEANLSSNAQDYEICVNNKTESNVVERDIDILEDILNILDNDKCDDDRGYVSIIDDNNSINNSNNSSNANDKSIDEKKSLKVDDKPSDSIVEEKRLESNDEDKKVNVEKDEENVDEKRLEIDSVLDDNDNIEKNKLIEADHGLEDIEEKEDESDDDAISLYAESLIHDKLERLTDSPTLPKFGDSSRPPTPQDDCNRMKSNTFDNYYQLTEQEFDNDYQNANIQVNCKGFTTRRFRNQLNQINNNQSSNKEPVECDSSYPRSPNSHTINDNHPHQLDSNYNIVRNKKLQGYDQTFIKQRNVFDPEVKRSNPTKEYVKHFFHGNCFQNLKTGNCTKINKCRHSHTISSKLQRIYLETPEKINMTLIYAFEQNFHFYLRDVYYKAVIRLDAKQIFHFFHIILFTNINVREIIPDYIKWTIDALILKNRPLSIIVSDLTDRLVQMGHMEKLVLTPSEVCNVVIGHLATKIVAGTYWQTFRSMIFNQVSLSPVIISYALQESIEFNKPLAHLMDIDYFLTNYSGEDFFMGIHPELYQRFMSLLDEQKRKEQAIYHENIVEIRQKPPETISLASPDNMDINSLPDNARPVISSMNENKYIPERDLIPLQSNSNIDSNSDNLKTKSVVNSVDNRQKIQEKVVNKHDAVPSTSKDDNTQIEATETLFANKYKLIPIDFQKPKSIYESHVWLLRSDLENIQTAIKKNDYDEIIKVLSINKRSQNQPFVRGFYTILCNEIMESVRHLNEIIQRTGNTYFDKSSTSGEVNIVYK